MKEHRQMDEQMVRTPIRHDILNNDTMIYGHLCKVCNSIKSFHQVLPF